MDRKRWTSWVRTAFTFAVVPIGLVLEFLVEFPFILATVLGGGPKFGRRPPEGNRDRAPGTPADGDAE